MVGELVPGQDPEGKVLDAAPEFNSFEVIVRDGGFYPIDFANVTPDMALISLHYSFPWAVCALAKWSLYCVATGRAMRLDTEIARWYAVADDPGRSWEQKLAAYRELVDDYYEADRFAEFCDQHLASADDCTREYVESPEFDDLLVATVQRAFPPHEHEQFVDHYRGLLAAWVNDQPPAGAAGP